MNWNSHEVIELEKGFSLDGSPRRPPLKKTLVVHPEVTSHEFNGLLFGPVNSYEFRSKISSEFIRNEFRSHEFTEKTEKRCSLGTTFMAEMAENLLRI